jgi:hypothetical protein
MARSLRLNILGLNLELELTAWLPLQVIYDLCLRLRWAWTRRADTKKSQEFIKYALRNLPNNSFIVFSFDRQSDVFVQLGNMGGNIVMDLPIWTTNAYYGKAEKIVRLLKSQKLTRQYSKNESFKPKTKSFALLPDWNVHNKQIKVNFGDDYGKAAEIAVLIAEKVFQIKNPILRKYTSARFMLIA